MLKNATQTAIILLGAISGMTSCSNSNDTQPNIVFIISEDICPDLSCYGRTDLSTPNLDSLASEGVRYTNAFSTSPVCSPSRSAIMTGLYQTSFGAHNHRSDIGNLPDSIVPFTKLLRDAGYYTCNVVNPEYGDEKTDFNFSGENFFDGDDWKHRKPGQSFYAQISIYTTHRDKHWEGIENMVEKPVDPYKIQLPSYYADHLVNRLDWARYLNSIQFMDVQVGKILERIEKEGLKENTVVIFIGDHGRCMIRGKQWLYDSGIKIPLIVRWPKQINPGTINENLVSTIDITASILQIAGVEIPEVMEGKAFIKLQEAIRDEIFAARDRCDGVVDRIRAVRTKEYKLIHNFLPEKPYAQFGHYKEFFYPSIHLHRVLNAEGKLTDVQKSFLAKTKPEFELYNIISDPEETINLASDEEYSEILSELNQKLDSWIEQTGDKGKVLESDEFIEELLIKRNEKYAPLWKKRGINPHDPPEVQLDWWKDNLAYNDYFQNTDLKLENAVSENFKTIDGQKLYAYFYFPENYSSTNKLPAIVFFHGGGWRSGKSTQFTEQSKYLASRGIIAIQADYRTMLRDGVSPFECVQDAKSAIRWVRKNAARFRIDPNKIAAGGGSAGGHLAAACGMLTGLDDPTEDLKISSIPDALVLFNPVLNNGPEGYRYDLFGENYKKISPFHNVRPGEPPVILMLGSEDPHLSPEQAEEFQSSMKAAGNDCELRIYEGQKHGFFNERKGGYKMYATTVYEMDKFLGKYGFLEGEPTISLEP
ncbi:MAG: sulfatase-like hydrolase/transferase [Bacteroidales bacterium]|nr:sulfatase-like hydrolase/transferase [Bacteroidales bacterium]MCF8389930.1 sulfatase-like hydrolase/transferase [Bacteroidales bacterium]